MKLTILAQRRQEAQEKLVTAVHTLADTLDLPQPQLVPSLRDPAVARLVRDEALGAFLTEVNEALATGHLSILEMESAVADMETTLSRQARQHIFLEDILAIPKLSKTSREAIEAYYANRQE